MADVKKPSATNRERRRWKITLIVCAAALLVMVNAAVFVLYGVESRPRMSDCKKNLREIGRLIRDYSTKNGRLPPREGDSLIPALKEKDKVENFKPDEKPELLDIFLCPFSESKRGESDYTGWDFPMRTDACVVKEGEYKGESLLLLWDKEEHEGGRMGLSFDNGHNPQVRFYTADEFSKEMEKLKVVKEKAQKNKP